MMRQEWKEDQGRDHTHTLKTCLQSIDRGDLKMWAQMPAPPIAVWYWAFKVCVCEYTGFLSRSLSLPLTTFSLFLSHTHTQTHAQTPLIYAHTHTHTHTHTHAHTYTRAHTQEGAMMRDVVLAIRADEAHHRVVNHTLSSMAPSDPNPYLPGQIASPSLTPFITQASPTNILIN